MRPQFALTVKKHVRARDEQATKEILKSPITLVGQSDAGAHLIYHAAMATLPASSVTGFASKK